MSTTAALALIAVSIVALALVTVAGIRYLSEVLAEETEGNRGPRRGTVN